MTEIFTMSEDDMFREIVDRGRRDAVTTKEAYDALVDQVVEDHLDMGELDVDQDTEGRADHLKEHWPEYEATLTT